MYTYIFIYICEYVNIKNIIITIHIYNSYIIITIDIQMS